jgi:hypothetical protein
MSGLALFDLAASSAKSDSTLLDVAKSWVDSLLSEVRYIRALDVALAQPTFDPKLAALLRGMYEEWARAAQIAEERLLRLTRAGHAIQGFAELRDQHGRVCAMLQVTVEGVEESRRQIAAGHVIPAEELRRELRSRVRT